MNTAQAISELKQFLSFKKASEHAEDVFKALQDAEQNTKDAEKDLAKLKAEIESLGKVKDKAKATLDAADNQAREIIADADVIAADVKAKAQLDAKELIDAAAKDVSKQKVTLEKIKAETKVYEIKLAEVTASLAAAQKEWAATQAKFKAVVGG